MACINTLISRKPIFDYKSAQKANQKVIPPLKSLKKQFFPHKFRYQSLFPQVSYTMNPAIVTVLLFLGVSVAVVSGGVCSLNI